MVIREELAMALKGSLYDH